MADVDRVQAVDGYFTAERVGDFGDGPDEGGEDVLGE